MTGPTPPRFDFDALYRGQSPADGVPAVTTPPWDTKVSKENVVAWQEAGLIHGEVLDIGCAPTRALRRPSGCWWPTEADYAWRR